MLIGMAKYDYIMRKVRRLFHLLHGEKVLKWHSDLRTNLIVPKIRANYERDLSRIRARVAAGDKLRVMFHVSDPAKWKLQTLYDKMLSSERFEPFVAVSIWGWHESWPTAEEQARKTEKFFLDKNMRVEMTYSFEAHKALPLNRFTPDVVFYSQPWDIPAEQEPAVVSRFALTCYVPYYTPNFDFGPVDCMLPFHREIFRYFIMNDKCAEICGSLRGSLPIAGDVVVSGHPMLDNFSPSDFGVAHEDGPVIYAPHWTFPHKDNPNSANISTFLWTGMPMLKYAKSHPEIKWAFKPHPVLKGMLLKSGVMTREAIDAYYSAWESIGESCYDGNYVELFKHSRALVTDCASFLTEYACTGNPIIRMVSPVAISKPGKLSESLYSTYYQVHAPEELEPMLDKILVRREDPNRDARQKAAKEMNLLGIDAAGNVVHYLESLIWRDSSFNAT